MEEGSIEVAAPDFIPSNEFQPENQNGGQPAPDFIPNSDFVSGNEPSEEQEGIGQTLLAGERGLERGLTGGVSDLIGKAYRNKAEGTTTQKIEENREAHPIVSGITEGVGTGALLAGTGGLGLAPAEGAGLLADVGSNVAQGALIGTANSVSNDAAFGDPNLAASKILSDASLSALYGGAIGGVGSALLGGASAGLKNVLGKVKQFGVPDLSISPEAMGPLNRIRMGFYQGIQSPEAQKGLASSASEALQSLNEISSMENLSALSDASQKEAIETFDNARSDFLKHFGDAKGKAIDPEEVMSFITNPASKNSTQQTIAFNHYFKAIKGLSEVNLSDANANKALKGAQSSLEDWLQELSSSSQTSPHMDIEYGGPAHSEGSSLDTNIASAKPYSTKFDLPPGEKITPNYSEGVTLGSGENTARVGSYGNESVSPFDQPRGYSLDTIQAKIKNYQEEISKLLDRQQEPSASAGELSESLKHAAGEANKLGNLSKSAEQIQNKPAPLGAGVGVIVSHIPYGPQLLTLYSAIRNYAGDGGLYRLGKDIASPVKVLDGVAATIQKVDQKIGDKARLIFTGTSSQARKVENE